MKSPVFYDAEFQAISRLRAYWTTRHGTLKTFSRSNLRREVFTIRALRAYGTAESRRHVFGAMNPLGLTTG